jgi:EF-P beta-lysylation protein EpmB
MNTPDAKLTDSAAVSTARQTPRWQLELSQAIRSGSELLSRLQLTSDQFPALLPDTAVADFPVLVPHSFLNRMQPGNPLDPLLLQVLPQSPEITSAPGFTADAVGDLHARRSPGLLHKYHGRVLLLAAGACAVHCRYCFRRQYPYAEEPRRLEDWEPAMAEIEADSDIREVILSGGDPLVLNDSRLAQLCHRIARIPHIDRLRIHTRLPIVLPSRVTPELLSLLTSLPKQILMVVHANHAAEIRDDCLAAVQQVVRAGLPILNQAVLLQNINDSADAQEQLSLSLVNAGVLPYYLHQLDRVDGTQHFEVSETVGQQILSALQARLPGYAVPRYVREIPGATGKTPLLRAWS